MVALILRGVSFANNLLTTETGVSILVSVSIALWNGLLIKPIWPCSSALNRPIYILPSRIGLPMLDLSLLYQLHMASFDFEGQLQIVVIPTSKI